MLIATLYKTRDSSQSTVVCQTLHCEKQVHAEHSSKLWSRKICTPAKIVPVTDSKSKQICTASEILPPPRPPVAWDRSRCDTTCSSDSDMAQLKPCANTWACETQNRWEIDILQIGHNYSLPLTSHLHSPADAARVRQPLVHAQCIFHVS